MARDAFGNYKPQKRTYGRHHQSKPSLNFLNSLLATNNDSRGKENIEDLPDSPPVSDRASLSSSALAFTPRAVSFHLPKKPQISTKRALLTPETDRNSRREPIRLSQNKFESKTDKSPEYKLRRSVASVKKNKRMSALAKIKPEETRHRPHSDKGTSNGWHGFAVSNAKKSGLKPPELRTAAPSKPARTKINLSPSGAPHINALDTPTEHQTQRPARTVPKLHFGPRPQHASSIEKLPDQILLKICVMTLNLDDQVSPYFQQGMLAYGILSYTDNDKGVVNRSNVDVSLLRTSKTFNEFGSAALYKLPRLAFRDPDVFSWWLRKIGPNFQLVNDLKLTLGSGWLDMFDNTELEDKSPFRGRCKEEKWHGLLGKIAKSHNLSRLELVFLDDHKINTQRRRGGKEADIEAVERDSSKLIYWRQKVVSLIEKYLRGIETFQIHDKWGRWCPRDVAHSLERLASQSRETAAERPLPSMMSLDEALADARRRGKTQTAISDEELEALEESARGSRHLVSVY